MNYYTVTSTLKVSINIKVYTSLLGLLIFVKKNVLEKTQIVMLFLAWHLFVLIWWIIVAKVKIKNLLLFVSFAVHSFELSTLGEPNEIKTNRTHPWFTLSIRFPRLIPKSPPGCFRPAGTRREEEFGATDGGLLPVHCPLALFTCEHSIFGLLTKRVIEWSPERRTSLAAGWRTADLSVGPEQLINSQLTASVRRGGGEKCLRKTFGQWGRRRGC